MAKRPRYQNLLLKRSQIIDKKALRFSERMLQTFKVAGEDDPFDFHGHAFGCSKQLIVSCLYLDGSELSTLNTRHDECGTQPSTSTSSFHRSLHS